MRNNLPVTGRCFAYPTGVTLVSVTDLKGRITYCNPAFVAVSGFSREELLGQPHNIVRHPEMPAEAFRDLWQTVQAGQTWSALVKNRRKDGDHYWVVANASPMRDGERIVGYLSVRSEASKEQIDAAESLYARLNEQAALGHERWGLQAGALVAKGRLAAATRRLRGVLEACGGHAWVLAGAVGAAVLAGALLPPAWAASLGLATAGAALVLCAGVERARWRGTVGAAMQLAGGDLASTPAVQAAGSVGEVQRALLQIAVNLRTVVADVRAEVTEVRTAVAEITAGNQDLSARTEQQASNLQQTAASMQEITNRVRQSAETAQEGARLADSTASVTELSHRSVQDVGQAMDDISQASGRIGAVIQVIEGVAFQTNILALNAAVEAARAGAQGRGFAVVATEVRALAQRAALAAKEVQALVGEATRCVATGSDHSHKSREQMGSALNAVRDVSRVLTDISTASAEQQVGIAEVNQAVSLMDGITQQNAAMVEQLAAAAQSLDGQIEAVMSSMQLFRLLPQDRTVAEVDATHLRRQMTEQATSV